MRWKTTIPVGVGVVLAVVAVAVVGAAMLLTDKGEEMIHLYGDYRAAKAGKQTDSMELFGKWRGMSLAAVNGQTAANLGVRGESGVVVAGVGPFCQQVGLRAGDVITGVDNQPVRDLAGLYNATKKASPAAPTVLEVNRQGQTVALVLPPAGQAAMGPGAGMGTRPELEANWGAGVPAAFNGQNFYCPRDGTVLPRGSVGSPFLCPRCQGPLHLYPPGVR
jgi:hypothetical protein